MAEEYRLVWILAVGLGCATLMGYLSQVLKLSPIIGYLAAGYLIGPHSFGILADQTSANQLANIGVTLLMFSVGLNFKWKEVFKFKYTVVPGVFLLALLSIAICILLGYFLNLSLISSIIIGIALSVSSTVVCVRIVSDHQLLKTKQGYLVVAWTIVDDLVSIIGLILLPSLVVLSIGNGSAFSWKVLGSFVFVLIKIGALGLLIYFFGQKVMSRFLKMIAKRQSRELFTLAVLSSVFLLALGSSYLFGISVALGAFVAGTIVGHTELSYQATADAVSTRDAFAVIFFLSIGMLFDPYVVWNNKLLFLSFLSVVVLFRPLVIFYVSKLAHLPSVMGLTLACAICQIGEYSFILAEEAYQLNLLPKAATDALIACSFVTVALNSFIFQLFDKKFKMSAIPDQRAQTLFNESHNGFFKPTPHLKPEALVIGFGPVGKAAANTLLEKYDVTIIDQDIEALSNKEERDFHFIYGDATIIEILNLADIGLKEIVVISTPDASLSTKLTSLIKDLNDKAMIIQRVHHLDDIQGALAAPELLVCDEQAVCEKMKNVISHLPRFHII